MRNLQQILEPSKTAVIVVDVQNDFCEPNGAVGKRGFSVEACAEMIPHLERLLDGAHAYGASVIFIQTIHTRWTDSDTWLYRSDERERLDTCREGSWGAEFFRVAPVANDPIVVKHRYSAFLNTRLESILNTLRIETLVITGVATNVCVESTARDGFQRDYNIVFVDDCSATYDRALHDATLKNMRNHFGTVAKADDVLKVWKEAYSVAPIRV
ncbi:MAG TPA: cysteine hydrolase [Candidatus Binatia bacterium]|nr:cysteine hydrolase [Candidatus Binatia bacterium]